MLSILLVAFLVCYALSYRASGTSVIAAIRRTAGWAAIGGLTGFVIGFVGPMLVKPDATQGPLLGVFVTGPLGAVLGLVTGTVREVRARLRSAQPV